MSPGARQIVVTPGMQESALEQVRRMTLGTLALAEDLRLADVAQDLAGVAVKIAAELHTHRARHGRTVPDTAPRA